MLRRGRRPCGGRNPADEGIVVGSNGEVKMVGEVVCEVDSISLKGGSVFRKNDE